MRDSLTVYEGVIYKGNKALIPKAMQAEMLTRIHKSHQGAESCIRKARDILFWVRKRCVWLRRQVNRGKD